MSSNHVMTDWGQVSSVSTTIRNILRDYSGDTSILYELLQNADDAGAKKVSFLLSKGILSAPDDEELPGTKLTDFYNGPTLFVYNDALFTEKDYDNLQKIGCMGKATDPNKTGKFGIGFNSVYHITDVPSFCSGSSVTFSDPQCSYVLPSRPGLRIQLSECRKYLKTFRGFEIMGPCITAPDDFYHGTLFRFPLRTEANAAQSEIKNEPVTYEQIMHLFEDFSQCGSSCLLFLKNICSVELLVVDTPTEIFATQPNWTRFYTINIAPESLPQLQAVRHQLFQLLATPEDHPRRGVMLEMFLDLEEQWGPDDARPKKALSQWVVVHAVGGGKAGTFSRKPAHVAKNLKPLGGVAMQLARQEWVAEEWIAVDSAIVGRAHCSLPLPLLTGMPFHINGFFELSSSRRNISYETHTGRQDWKVQWNTVLGSSAIAPAITHAFSLLLQTLSDSIAADQDQEVAQMAHFYSLWPLREAGANPYFQGIVDDVYDLLWSNAKLPSMAVHGAQGYEFLPLRDASYWDAQVLARISPSEPESLSQRTDKIRATVLEAVRIIDPHRDHLVIAAIPDHLVQSLQSWAASRKKPLRIIDPPALRAELVALKKSKSFLQSSFNTHYAQHPESLNQFIEFLLSDLDLRIVPTATRALQDLPIFIVGNPVPPEEALALGASQEEDLILYESPYLTTPSPRQRLVLSRDGIGQQLLPQCASTFVSLQQLDTDLSGLFQAKAVMDKLGFVDFGPQVLAECLDRNFPEARKWTKSTVVEPQPGDGLTSTWLLAFWNYAVSFIREPEVLFKLFGQWPFIPTHNNRLVKIKEAGKVFVPQNMSSSRIGHILEQAGCLILQDSNEAGGKSCAAILHPFFSHFNPEGIVQSLSALKSFDSLTDQDRSDLIDFIVSHGGIQALSREGRKILRSLPLHRSLQNTWITLPPRTAWYLVESEELRDLCLHLVEHRVILSQYLQWSNDRDRRELLLGLDVQELPIKKFCTKIAFNAIQQRKIKSPAAMDRLATFFFNHWESLNSPTPNPLLGSLAFLHSGNRFFAPTELILPADAEAKLLFQILFDSSPERFLPERFFGQQDKLKQVGLITTIDGSIVVECARQLHQRCQAGPLTDQLQRCSATLFRFIMEPLHVAQILPLASQLATIPFLIGERNQFFGQTAKPADRFMTFQQLHLSHPLLRHEDPLRNHRLLPRSWFLPHADPAFDLCRALGIPDQPSPERVLEEFQFIMGLPQPEQHHGCLQVMFEEFDSAIAQGLPCVRKIVQYLRSQVCFPLSTAEGLQMVAASWLVCADPVSPLLFQVPDYLRNLHHLQKALNVLPKPDAPSLQKALQRLKVKYPDSLPESARDAAVRACQKLFQLKENGEAMPAHFDVLVPTVDHELRLATECVYIDQNYLRKCIKIADPIFEADLPRNVAQYLRVNPIHTVVRETVAADFRFELINDAASDEWIAQKVQLLASAEFIEGVARIRLLDEANLPHDISAHYREQFGSLKISFVKNLSTRLIHSRTGKDVTADCDSQTNAYYDDRKHTIFLNHRIGLKFCTLSFEAKVCELLGFLAVSPSQKEAISVLLDSSPSAVHESLNLFRVPDIDHRQTLPDPPKEELVTTSSSNTESSLKLSENSSTLSEDSSSPVFNSSSPILNGSENSSSPILNRSENSSSPILNGSDNSSPPTTSNAIPDEITIDDEQPKQQITMEDNGRDIAKTPEHQEGPSRREKIIQSVPPTERPTDDGYLVQVQQAVKKSSESSKVFTKHHQPEQRKIEKYESFRDEPELYREQIGIFSSHLRFYLEKDLTSGAFEPFDMEAAKMFASMILLMSYRVFSIVPRREHCCLNIYAGHHSKIAFNMGSQLFFNLNHFKSNYPFKSLDHFFESLDYWYAVFCHELSHNCHKAHDESFAGLMGKIVSTHLGKYFQLKVKIWKLGVAWDKHFELPQFKLLDGRSWSEFTVFSSSSSSSSSVTPTIPTENDPDSNKSKTRPHPKAATELISRIRTSTNPSSKIIRQLTLE